MTDHEEMQAVAAGRAKTYGVLSALYTAAPAGDLADMIRAGGLIAASASGPLCAAADELTASFSEAATQGFDNELVAEHTRLFVLPSGVVPHESMYLDENKRLGGRVTAGVQQYYQDAGAQLAKACLELPDHIGVELEFMKFLCEIEAQFWSQPNLDGLRRCLEFQSGFLAEHLLRWYAALCEKVLSETELQIYRAVAHLTAEFLNAEREFVPELAKEISEWRKECASES